MLLLAGHTQLTPQNRVAAGLGDFLTTFGALSSRVGYRLACEPGAAGVFAQGVGQHFGLTRLGAVYVVCQRMPSVSSQFKRSVMRPAHKP